MRTARLSLLGPSLVLLAACGAPGPTAPGDPPASEKPARDACGYLGSAGCPATPAPTPGG